MPSLRPRLPAAVRHLIAAVLLASCPAISSLALAASPLPAVNGSTSVTIIVGNHPGDRSTVDLLPGDTLRLVTGLDESTITSIQWLKNGAPVGQGDPVFVLASVTDDDSGVYSARVTLGDISGTIGEAPVRVGVPLRQQLLNLSSRATISPANPVLTSGFVIATNPGQPKQMKYLLIRAVGGSLAAFGIEHPLADIGFRIYKADGSNYQESDPTLQVYNNMLRIPFSQIATQVGAFPLTPHAGADDVQVAWPFPAGVYSIQVFSNSGGTGEVLLEIYEIPDSLVETP